MYEELKYIPPKLPQKDDSDVLKSGALIEEVLAALRLLRAHSPEQERSEWTPCIEMVGSMLELRDHFGGLVAEKAETMLRKMADGGTNVPESEDETSA